MSEEMISVGRRQCRVYADPSPEYLLIQPADDYELELFPAEAGHIRALTDKPFILASFEVKDWNNELSPWDAPAVFGSEPFGNGAGKTLQYIEEKLIPELIKRYALVEDIPVILGGYSLAGLFALWAGYSSKRFSATAGASPSVWFPGWTELAEERSPAVRCIYLSLGKKEEKARNRIMATVGDNIRRLYDILLSKNIPSKLEWNEGNHFTEPELRTAKGFAWCIGELSGNNG